MTQLPASTYFKDYLFYEKGHRYINITEPKQKYRSSTGVKKDFINEFRGPYWVAWKVIKAKDHSAVNDFGGKCTHDHFKIQGKEYHYEKVWEKFPEECKAIRKQWDDEAEFGRDKGNSVHDFLENLMRKKVTTFKKEHKPWIDQAYDFWKKEDRSNVKFSEMEIIVGDFEKKICGMIDRLDYLSYPLVKVVDLKSDKDLNDTDNYQQLLGPFAHLGQNPINEYSIQVNIYADVLERNTPYKVDQIELVNITDEKWEVRKINRFKVLEYL